MATQTTSPSPFRFMDLPISVRCIVYNFLPRTVKQCHIRDIGPKGRIMTTLIVKLIPVSILATCKLIHAEAKPILERLREDFFFRC
ncbi:hypothetical protein BDV95DRAFT_170043 [Massariosphaeria phaeospora]|uniref:Uncharacterized protein n=1 Tax=Massariosphaeria phaeospora TaxID=100035 RepID=A0A7C8I409_9PLEO|nr:hypothetical protein BDV95DRAFT_170043 [Massariosphaeria phaeospora]